jgi:hypothetical protein
MTLAAAIHAGFATAKTERVVASGLRLEVARVKITEARDSSRRYRLAGRKLLDDRPQSTRQIGDSRNRVWM